MASTDLEEEAVAEMMCRASCGIAEVDDVKLEKCADCHLVQYCSDKCQQEQATPLLRLDLVLLLIFSSLLWKKLRGGNNKKMSANEAADMTLCCASCGVAEVDEVKLKKCGDCDLVGYCSDKCQREHRPKHDSICRERAAELRDEMLFRQPESTHLGDCPICFLPLPNDAKKPVVMACCSKMICEGCFYANLIRQMEELCNGCDYANYLREMEERLQQTCPFCRHPVPKTEEEMGEYVMKRVKAKDPIAILKMGEKLYEEGNYDTGFEYYGKAAELGAVHAHYILAHLYREGQGVEKDEETELYHLEEAAIAGHPGARYNLACHEAENKRYERAVKHFIIAANLGCDDSIQALKQCYKEGIVSKEDFAAALRAHQAAVDATKSPQREAVAKAEVSGDYIVGVNH